MPARRATSAPVDRKDCTMTRTPPPYLTDSDDDGDLTWGIAPHVA